LLLAEHILQRLGSSADALDEGARVALRNYRFPGNVRELENVIERAVTLETGEFIQKERLTEKVRGDTTPAEVSLPRLSREDGLDLDDCLKGIERKIIGQALQLTEGNQTRAAELLQISYRSLRHRIETLEIKKEKKEA